MKKLSLIACLLLPLCSAYAQIDEGLLLDQINQLRAEGCRCGNKDVKPTNELHWNADLADIAKEYSEHLFDNNQELVVGQYLYLSHVGLDGSSLEDRLRDGGMNVRHAVENLACIEGNELMVIDHWLNNPESCLHLMDNDVTIVGIGRTGKFWVVILAQPAIKKEKEEYK